ncbi:MAG: pentapeptide repeat-containing protein [Planctomycetes bacterium]|nr:pentapeptide repeat-containing protein [Planctomycetota bacterium]
MRVAVRENYVMFQSGFSETGMVLDTTSLLQLNCGLLRFNLQDGKWGAKESTAAPSAGKNRKRAKKLPGGPASFEGLSFCVSELDEREEEQLVAAIRPEQGEIAAILTANVSYLVLEKVLTRGKSAAQRYAEKLNRKGAKIKILDVSKAWSLLTPSPDEARALLAAGTRGVARWNARLSSIPFDQRDKAINLSGSDFTDQKLASARLDCCKLRGANCAGADLSSAEFADCASVSFRNAKLAAAEFSDAI